MLFYFFALILHLSFAAGGVATPADAAMMMQLGMDGVFVGSGIFKSGDPEKRARAIVMAVSHFKDAKVLAEVSTGLGPGSYPLNLPCIVPLFTDSSLGFVFSAMVGITDLANDPVNFRDREGGGDHHHSNADGVPKKRKVYGHTEKQLYGSSWEAAQEMKG